MCISRGLKTAERVPQHLISPLVSNRVGTYSAVQRYVHFTLALVQVCLATESLGAVISVSVLMMLGFLKFDSRTFCRASPVLVVGFSLEFNWCAGWLLLVYFEHMPHEGVNLGGADVLGVWGDFMAGADDDE